MYINKIRLVNFRGMEDLTVEFAQGVNVIIGDNGAGKTSLLNGINSILKSFFSSAKIEKKDVRVSFANVGDATQSMTYYTPTIIQAFVHLKDKECECVCSKRNEASETKNTSGFIAELLRLMENDSRHVLPLFNYQSDRRNLLLEEKMEQTPTGRIERRQGYKGAFSGIFDANSVQKWCFQMELNEFQQKKKFSEYENFKKNISRFIEYIEEKKVGSNVYFDSEIWSLAYFDGKSKQPLYNLSSGYQSVLCMIMELAYRAVLLNPTLDNFETLEGIVIIDEIDMHLHPKWQWKILDALHTTFPSIQFIVATHSPMIISSAKGARLLRMKSPNDIEPMTSAYGYSISDVVELRQGSTELPQLAKTLKDKLEDCIDRDDLEEAQRIVQEAIENFGEDSSPVREMKDFLEVNKWVTEAD